MIISLVHVIEHPVHHHRLVHTHVAICMQQSICIGVNHKYKLWGMAFKPAQCIY